jgi:hypothetical protein
VNKERFDANVELAKIYAEQRRGRMQTEWQLTFGLWTALGALSLVSFTTPLPLTFAILVAVVAMLAYLAGTIEFFRRAYADGVRIDRFLERAVSLEGGEAPPSGAVNTEVVPAGWRRCLSSPLVRLRILITLAGCAILVVAGIFTPATHPEKPLEVVVVDQRNPA